MEPAKDILHLAHHRSRTRIRDFGEVFTPEKYVQQMLDMLDRSVWADTRTVFFEPTCGHGNFVSAIVERRLKAFLKKAKRQKIKNPPFYAVANTLNNLWAIDIDSKNIEFCRQRVFNTVCRFLWKHVDNLSCPRQSFFQFGDAVHFNPLDQSGVFRKGFVRKHRDFLVHVLCCLEWQIQENEALSCLETDPVKAEKSADKTAVSRTWFKKNGHRPIDFKNTWCQYFQNCKTDKTTLNIRGLKDLDSKIGSFLQKQESRQNIDFQKKAA